MYNVFVPLAREDGGSAVCGTLVAHALKLLKSLAEFAVAWGCYYIQPRSSHPSLPGFAMGAASAAPPLHLAPFQPFTAASASLSPCRDSLCRLLSVPFMSVPFHDPVGLQYSVWRSADPVHQSLILARAQSWPGGHGHGCHHRRRRVTSSGHLEPPP